MKLDCYPRFKKSQVIKDCLCAEMEGKPLPVSLLPTSSSSNVTSTVHKVTGPDYGKKKVSCLLVLYTVHILVQKSCKLVVVLFCIY